MLRKAASRAGLAALRALGAQGPAQEVRSSLRFHRRAGWRSVGPAVAGVSGRRALGPVSSAGRAARSCVEDAACGGRRERIGQPSRAPSCPQAFLESRPALAQLARTISASSSPALAQAAEKPVPEGMGLVQQVRGGPAGDATTRATASALRGRPAARWRDHAPRFCYEWPGWGGKEPGGRPRGAPAEWRCPHGTARACAIPRPRPPPGRRWWVPWWTSSSRRGSCPPL